MARRGTPVRLWIVAALSLAILFAMGGIANAAESDKTLGLDALRAKLGTGPLQGYFKTVTRGHTIEEIPVEVLSVTGDDPADALIMFEATGTQIARFGGIVSGMSGSPIYVKDDDGFDKVIGAVAYGDMFTIGGMGLATPIESMVKLDVDYSPRMQPLDRPQLTKSGLVDRIIVAPNPSAFKGAARSGAFVAKPLSSVFIGGLRPSSRTYAQLKKALEARGLSVVSLGAALSAGHDTTSTALVPGASVGALLSRGDLWIGGLGTVAYTATDTVVAFGHPAYYLGETSMYMTNVWINGVWPSQLTPYKIGHPTALRGTFTQDRSAGIYGTTGALPDEVAFTSRAVLKDSGREATSNVYLASKLLNSGMTSLFSGSASSIAASRLFDAATTPGSALTTATVRVSDGTTEYDVVMTNVVDSPYDIPSSVGADVNYIVSELLSVLADGVEEPRILSVDTESEISTARNFGRVVAVAPEAGLKIGANRIKVSVLAYGVRATQTVDATINLPAGTPLTGTLIAAGPGGDTSGMEMTSGDPGSAPQAPAARRSIAQIVDELNAVLPNNTLTVSFRAEPVGDPFSDAPPSSDATISIDATTATPWVIAGQATLMAPGITAQAFPNPIPYGDVAIIAGEISGIDNPCTVSIYGTPVGSDVETLLATETATVAEGTIGFGAELWDLETNTRIRVHIDGTSTYAPADTTFDLGVRARVLVGTSARTVRRGRSVTLTALVANGANTGPVTFQYYNAARRRWTPIGVRSLVAGDPYARATIGWRPPRGTTRVRVVYGGGIFNAGAVSSYTNVTAR
ncbi:MAG: hypothetical protein Q7W30_05855 [Coriobacteriia bacterium]|nr:hypothetical protein [Coriobacteriia bacterium]